MNNCQHIRRGQKGRYLKGPICGNPDPPVSKGFMEVNEPAHPLLNDACSDGILGH